jgi:hypothetical protein
LADRQTLPEDTFLDGSYRIVRVIGAGGFGITYEAEDIKLATRVAIKEYFPLEFGDRDASQTVRPRSEATTQLFEWGRENFLTEARTLASFDHASIVRVLRVFEANATAYMVMRFEKGLSFEDWLKSLERLPTQRELDAVCRPLLDALSELHSVDYLHRDIAPDNIIIRSDGTPVLLDFGSARHVVAEKSRAITGIVKAGYSPQEQYASDNKHQGPWTDIYALGGTLYRAVTGKRPPESMLRFDEASYEPAAVVARGKYRVPFLEAIDRALAVKPVDRPQSVANLREQLFRPEGSPTVIVPREALQTGGAASAASTLWPAGILANPKVQKGALAAVVLIGALSGLKIAHHLELLPAAFLSRSTIAASGDGDRAASEAKRLAALDVERQRDAAAKAQADAERRRQAEIEAERERAEAEKKRIADAEAARLRDEAEKKRLADIEAERQRVEAEKKRAADAEAARLRAEAEKKRLAEIEAERQRVDAEKKKAAEAEAARLRAEAEKKRLAEIEAERQRVDAEKKKAAEAEAARLKAEAEKKRLAAIEAERLRVEAEKKKVADAEAARLKAEAEKKRLAEVEAERLRVEAEKKKAAEAEAEKKRLADVEAERLRRDAVLPPTSRQDGGRQGVAGGGSDGGLEEFLASYRELLRAQQCSVASLTTAQLEKSVPGYIDAVNKLQNAQLEKIDFQTASPSAFNAWLTKAHARKSATCPFDPLGTNAPAAPRPVVQPVQKAPQQVYRPAPAAPRAAPAPSQRTIMGIQ